MRSWKSDVLVTLSALLIAGLFGYLYYQDINRQSSLSSGKPIGTLIYKRNDTQRRFSDREVWQPVDDNAPLYNHDSIRTVAGSEAVLRLSDGTQITMQPNTLITLDWGAKAKSVDFLGGSISAVRSGSAALPSASGTASAGSGLVIRSGRSQLTIGTASVNLSHAKSGGFDVVVASGSAALSTGSTVHTLTTAETASIDASGNKASIATEKILPSAPTANAIYVTQAAQTTIPFAWSSAVKATSYSVELATSPDFKQGVQSVQTADTSTPVKLPQGSYFWRIVALGATSASQRLTILNDGPLVPRNPSDGTVFTYSTTLPLVTLAWSPSSEASGYELQIASDPGFSQIVDTVSAATSSISVESLGAGSYYWRVTPVYDFAQHSSVLPSRVSSFRIVRQSNLSAPKLIIPEEGTTLSAATISSEGMLFNWQADQSVGRWTVTVSRNADLTNPIIRSSTTDNYLVSRTQLPPGSYHWQVTGDALNGIQVPPSANQSFTVALHSSRITLQSPRPNWNYDGATISTVPVVWRSDLGGSFKVQLSTTPDFSAIYSQITTNLNNTTFGSIPPGTYYWHVLLIGSDGSTLLTSGDESFTVMPPLVAPVAVTPEGGAVLDLINPKKIDFGWDGDPRSKFYDFTLYSGGASGARQVIAKADNLKANSYSLSDLSGLGRGDYSWSVVAHNPQAFNASAQQTLPTISTFSIGDLRVIPAPALQSPADASTIDGVKALDNGVTFRWIPPDPLGTATVLVASDPAFTQNVKQLSAGPGAAAVHAAELLPGTYYWRVDARTRDGIAAPASAHDEFTVTALASLAEPSRLSPARGSEDDMWNKKALSFSWQAVPDATGYIISLTNSSTGREIFRNVRVSGSEYSFSDLANLDVGNFQWEIQAYQSDNSGAVVRESSVVKLPFRIILGNSIGTPNVKSPSRVFVH
ncbi:MAG TPA: hypothetical protein VMV68_07885 [Spirochaetia bacterium]|nr:hypothetical protein [Spirochaetia bacterium]